MSTTNDQVNYVDVIKDIEQFYAENSITVNALITSTGLKFKPLSVKQLKSFIELQIAAAKDEYGVVSGLDAVTKLNEILVENSLDHKEKLLGSLSLLDRDAIMLQLRADVKPEVEIPIQDSDDTLKINLNDIVKRIKAAKFPKTLKERTKTMKFSGGTFVVNLQLPSLLVDSHVNNKFKSVIVPALKKGSKHVEKQVDKLLSQVYFLELYKYINTVTIDKKGEGKTVVNFRDLSNFDQNYKLLDSLPTQIIANISEFMTDVREYKDSIFFYENQDEKDVPLDVDIGLFAGI